MKINTKTTVFYEKKGRKILLTMKLSLFLIFMSVFQVSAISIFSQNLKISIEMQDVTVRDVIKEVERQGKMSFFFNDELQELNTKISVSLKDTPVSEVLENALSQANMTFTEIRDNFIVLIPLNADNSSQPVKISGKVTDASTGELLAGVSVVIEGTTRGTISDIRGEYSLEDVRPENVIVFSFVGYVSQKVVVGSNRTINIAFVPELMSLEEVVVVGYGTQRKKDLTGSIASVSGDELEKSVSLSFDQALQGKIPGVQITQTSGAPGGNVNIMVRGVSSITGGNMPLYVVDGFPIGTGGGGSDVSSFLTNTYTASGMANNAANRINPLSTINPADIESIEVLKDASATAIYGSRGANGVVIITTKRGKVGKPVIEFSASYGIQEVENKLEMMNSREFAEFVADGRDAAWVYGGTGRLPTDPNSVRPTSQQVKDIFRTPELITVNTDWQDVIFRTAPVQEYQLSASGGQENIRYMLSGGYFNQEGIILGSDYQRYNIRANTDVNLSKRLKLGSTISGSYGYGDFIQTEGALGLRGVIGCALASSPAIPVYREDGSTFDELLDPQGVPVENPLYVIQETSDKRNLTEIITNNYLDFEIINGLNFRTSIGINFNTGQTKLWKSSQIGQWQSKTAPATAGLINKKTFNWLNENTLTYQKLINNRHNINAMIGFTAQKDNYDHIAAGATDFPTDYITYLAGGTVNAGTHYRSEWTLLSLLARVNYMLDEKYLLTLTVRRDGSSRFGSENKWGTFPSASVGYRISDEEFMKNIEFISDMKVRLSYGVSGNNLIGNYSHIGLLSQGNYVNSNKLVPGLIPSGLSNTALTWEKSNQVDFGLDLGLFDNKVTMVADIYRNLKTDLLLSVQLPAASGFTASTQNIGEVENKGIEFGLNINNIQWNKFTWSSNFNISANKNEVTKLATEGALIPNSSYQATAVGQPISSFYLMHVLGVFKTNEEVELHPIQHPNTQAGDLRFEDVNNDDKITNDDMKFVGDPWPDFIWGWSNLFKYKNISLNVFINGSQGNKVLIPGSSGLLNVAGVQNQLKFVVNRWRSEENPGDGMTPRAIRNNYANGFGSNIDRGLFDGSYVRIKEVTLSYDIPKKYINYLKLQGLNAYFNISNLITFTDFPGYNPEGFATGDNVTKMGVDDGSYPLARTYTFGVRLSF